jgi:hypothetical protein
LGVGIDRFVIGDALLDLGQMRCSPALEHAQDSERHRYLGEVGRWTTGESGLSTVFGEPLSSIANATTNE